MFNFFYCIVIVESGTRISQLLSAIPIIIPLNLPIFFFCFNEKNSYRRIQESATRFQQMIRDCALKILFCTSRFAIFAFARNIIFFQIFCPFVSTLSQAHFEGTTNIVLGIRPTSWGFAAAHTLGYVRQTFEKTNV